MRVNCPLCAEPFDVPSSGNHACAHCKSPVIVAPDGSVTAADPRTGSQPSTKIPEWARDGRGPTPWEQREELGIFTALYQTIGRSIFRPTSFFSTVDPHRSWGEAFAFAWIITTVSAILQALINIVNFRNIRNELASTPELWSELPAQASEWIDWVAGNSVTVAFGLCLFTIILFPLSFMIGAGVIHLGCMLFGCADNGFGATARTMAYCTGPTLVTWVPQVGGLIGIYVVVLQVLGLSQTQETSFGRAVAAVLVLPIVVACCIAPTVIGILAMAFVPSVL